MTKTHRRHTILRLLEEHVIESQEQLAQLLAEAGQPVNQATLSRDLRSLGVVKAPQGGGGARYVEGATRPWDREVAVGNLRGFLREIVASGNLLVLRTRVGGAQPVGLALDRLPVPGIIGTVAGDDTVMAVLAEGQSAQETIRAIWALIEGQRGDDP